MMQLLTKHWLLFEVCSNMVKKLNNIKGLNVELQDYVFEEIYSRASDGQ